MSKEPVTEAEVLDFLRNKADRLRDRHGVNHSRSTTIVLAKNELFLQQLELLLKAHPAPKPIPYHGKKGQKTQRILNLMLSDLHYGSDLVPEETGNKYGPVEEARRTAAVVKTAADWKLQYRAETELYVHLIGDIIEGKLHDPEAAAPLAEQFRRAMWNLDQALRFLASQFKRVTVFTSPGNHGRRKDRHPGRAVNQKWDGIENMLYGALQISLANVENLTMDIPLTPYYIYKAFDQKGFMTHGDTVVKAGNPGQSIRVDALRKNINEINLKEHCQLFGVGHVHVPSATRLPNGVVLVTNGCLVPSGDFSQSIGIMESACSQQIWESVPGIIYGHRMDILVDERTDKDDSLDAIVKPFPGMAAFGGRNGRGNAGR